MNWNAIAAVGEILGAAAVVISLVYVAVQVRQNTKALHRSASADAVAAIRDWNRDIAVNPELNRVYRDGVEGLESLTADDRAQFGVVVFNLFKTFEDLHYQYLNGAMDPVIWSGWENIARVSLTSPGCREYYESRHSYFNPRFQEWMERQSADDGFERLRRVTGHGNDPTTGV